MRFLHLNMERLCNLSKVFLRNLVNLITRMVCMEIYGDSAESGTFYRDFILKLVWRLSGVFMKKINYQTISILSLLLNLHKSIILSYRLRTIYIIST